MRARDAAGRAAAPAAHAPRGERVRRRATRLGRTDARAATRSCALQYLADHEPTDAAGPAWKPEQVIPASDNVREFLDSPGDDGNRTRPTGKTFGRMKMLPATGQGGRNFRRRRNEHEGEEDYVAGPPRQEWHILRCTTCHRTLSRDFNAAHNIATVASAMLRHKGHRPLPLRPLDYGHAGRGGPPGD